MKDTGYSWMVFKFKFWCLLAALWALIYEINETFIKFGIRLADGKHDTVIACIFIVVGILGLVVLSRIAGQYYDE